MPNADLARRVLDQITDEDAAYDQEHWMQGVTVLEPHRAPASCGTTLCAAGWAVHLSGYTIKKEPGVCTIEYTADGPRDFVAHVAALELGLNEEDAEWLFAEGDDPYEVEAAVGQLAEGADRIIWKDGCRSRRADLNGLPDALTVAF
ncbi:hypothetical protein [Streptomyces sp. NBC_00470]|uniref:hypothetical protein n=1 Tax=Streptomyces sp. NBC_00470 TaxID=2975753 RepID=UPI002F90A62D